MMKTSPQNHALAWVNKGLQKLFGLPQDWYLQRDIVKNNYNLGVSNLEKGNYQDAAFRLNFLTWLDPEHQQGWLQLARAYIGQGQKLKAIRALKKLLALNPQHAEAKQLLAVVSGKVPAPRAIEISTEQDAHLLYHLHQQSFPIYWKEA